MEWISVKDRLPEETGRYWCYCEEINPLGIAHYQWNCCFSISSLSFTDALRVINVTHWMPLPEPPKTI